MAQHGPLPRDPQRRCHPNPRPLGLAFFLSPHLPAGQLPGAQKAQRQDPHPRPRPRVTGAGGHGRPAGPGTILRPTGWAFQEPGNGREGRGRGGARTREAGPRAGPCRPACRQAGPVHRARGGRGRRAARGSPRRGRALTLGRGDRRAAGAARGRAGPEGADTRGRAPRPPARREEAGPRAASREGGGPVRGAARRLAGARGPPRARLRLAPAAPPRAPGRRPSERRVRRAGRARHAAPCASATRSRELVPRPAAAPPPPRPPRRRRPRREGRPRPRRAAAAAAAAPRGRPARRARPGGGGGRGGAPAAPPPRRDPRRRGPKARGEAAAPCERLGLRRGRRVQRVHAGPGPGRARRADGAARHAAVQVRLAGAAVRAGRRGAPAREDPAASQGGQGELREGLPGGRRAGQRRLRHGLRGQPPRRRAPGGREARGEGAGDGVGQPGRRGRAPRGGAAAQGGRGGRRARRHPPAGLVRAARRLPAGAGAARAGPGPLRLHHGARRPGRAAGAPLLRAGAGRGAALPRLRRGAPRHQGREPAGGPALGRAQAHRLRLGRAAQGHGLHRLRRHARVQPPRVDPLPPLPRALGHRVVPGRAALRHGVRGHPLRAGRGDPQGPPLLPEEGLSRVSAAHPVVSVPAALGAALSGPDLRAPLDAGGRGRGPGQLCAAALWPGRRRRGQHHVQQRELVRGGGRAPGVHRGRPAPRFECLSPRGSRPCSSELALSKDPPVDPPADLSPLCCCGGGPGRGSGTLDSPPGAHLLPGHSRACTSNATGPPAGPCQAC